MEIGIEEREEAQDNKILGSPVIVKDKSQLNSNSNLQNLNQEINNQRDNMQDIHFSSNKLDESGNILQDIPVVHTQMLQNSNLQQEANLNDSKNNELENNIQKSNVIEGSQQKSNSQSQISMFNNSQKQDLKPQQSQFIESQGIYSKKQNENENNNENPEVPENLPNYGNPQNPEGLPFIGLSQNPNNNEEGKEKQEPVNDMKQFESHFDRIKISKTKYLSEEDISKMNINNNENNENNDMNNNNNEQELNPSQNIFNANTVKQTEFVDNENDTDINIQRTNDENLASNILGNNAMMKISETKYINEDDKSNNNEIYSEPKLKKHTVKILKIEDVEDPQMCPDFVSNILKKLFG